MSTSAAIRFAPFAKLNTSELYELLKLRFDVFVLEQQSLYPELDGKDPGALHLIVEAEGAMIGCARLLWAPDEGAVTIGRVALAKGQRGTGLGRRIIDTALVHISAALPGRDAALGAQLQLEPFYASFGFARVSEIYDDGGIPHVDMVRPADKVSP